MFLVSSNRCQIHIIVIIVIVIIVLFSFQMIVIFENISLKITWAVKKRNGTSPMWVRGQHWSAVDDLALIKYIESSEKLELILMIST